MLTRRVYYDSTGQAIPVKAQAQQTQARLPLYNRVYMRNLQGSRFYNNMPRPSTQPRRPPDYLTPHPSTTPEQSSQAENLNEITGGQLSSPYLVYKPQPPVRNLTARQAAELEEKHNSILGRIGRKLDEPVKGWSLIFEKGEKYLDKYRRRGGVKGAAATLAMGGLAVGSGIGAGMAGLIAPSTYRGMARMLSPRRNILGGIADTSKIKSLAGNPLEAGFIAGSIIGPLLLPGPKVSRTARVEPDLAAAEDLAVIDKPLYRADLPRGETAAVVKEKIGSGGSATELLAYGPSREKGLRWGDVEVGEAPLIRARSKYNVSPPPDYEYNKIRVPELGLEAEERIHVSRDKSMVVQPYRDLLKGEPDYVVTRHVRGELGGRSFEGVEVYGFDTRRGRASFVRAWTDPAELRAYDRSLVEKQVGEIKGMFRPRPIDVVVGEYRFRFIRPPIMGNAGHRSNTSNTDSMRITGLGGYPGKTNLLVGSNSSTRTYVSGLPVLSLTYFERTRRRRLLPTPLRSIFKPQPVNKGRIKPGIFEDIHITTRTGLGGYTIPGFRQEEKQLQRQRSRARALYGGPPPERINYRIPIALPHPGKPGKAPSSHKRIRLRRKYSEILYPSLPPPPVL